MTLSALRTALTCLYNKELARILISVNVNSWYINNDYKGYISMNTLREIMEKRK